MMNLEELQDDLKIAKHNVWVSKTNLEDREMEVRRIERQINKLKEVSE